MERSKKTLKRHGKSASSTSEGSPSPGKDKSSGSAQVAELDLDGLVSTTMQEVSVSSSIEGPELQKDNVLVCLSTRYSRNLQKNRLQPMASRRAVRMVC